MARVLVAEDDALLSSFLVKRLQVEGYETRAAYDGQATIDAVKNWKPDLLLLDILMPVKDGYDVLAEMRADSAVASTPVLVVSNLSADQDIQRAKEFGVKYFVTKADTTPEAVAQKVRDMLA